MIRILRSVKSLTASLAAFFISISFAIGITTLIVCTYAIQWSEDRMGEKRIRLDRDIAVERFIAGENGKISIDPLTDAYNDLSLVPKNYREFLSSKESFLDEVELGKDAISHMVYKSAYTHNGQNRDIVLLTSIDNLESEFEEIIYSSLIVVSLVFILMCIFGAVLYRLSARLIEPFNDIIKQLETYTGKSETPFSISAEASNEFQLLTNRLNQYRTDLNLALKREKAFARYASHELRTPLAIVKGANKLLNKKEQNDFSQRQINRIDNATDQMSIMIDALLSLVRYERNNDDIPIREIRTEELENIVADNSLQANDKEINIRLNVISNPILQASPSIINMVIGNLIRNAISATAKGEITINVDLNHITIIDDGTGLNSSSNKDGHGLGLLIVEDLSHRYGWKFSLTNHINRGCVAKIAFS